MINYRLILVLISFESERIFASGRLFKISLSESIGGVHILYNADGVGGWVEVLLYFVIYGGGVLTFVI